MIKKIELLSMIQKLENKLDKVESELFEIQFPNGKITKTGVFTNFIPDSLLTYSYVYLNKIQEVNIISLLFQGNLRTIHIKKDKDQAIFKVVLGNTYYILLDKKTQVITELSKEIFVEKDEWINLDIIN